MVKLTEEIVIRITGDSGDGVQIVGEQLTITAAMTGKDVRTLPDFPAEIRAPAGTVAGVSGFQLAMAEHAIFTAGESLDVLVALNPAALKHSLSFLNEGGLLIVNADNMQSKDWEKAGLSAGYFDEVKDRYQVLSLPLVSHTLAALKELEMSHAQAKKAKNFYVLGIVLWLFDLTMDSSLAFINKKFKKATVSATANRLALLAGYHYAETLELARAQYMLGGVDRPAGEYRQITGVEAVSMALATLAVKTNQPLLVAGYPITPASGILHECAKLQSFGVTLLQAEDEIAAICACLGAAFGGRLAVTFTSGPGFDLKSESLGLAVVSELPLVVVDVQRAGASTGMPTKTSQSDLYQAMFGRHGEAPLPVLAATSPVDCFKTMLEAFTIAIAAMSPVIVLLDAYIVNAAEPWQIPDVDDIAVPQWSFNQFAKPYLRDQYLARSWNIPGTPGLIHQLGGLEKQGEEGRVSYDASNHQTMVKTRAQKIANVTRLYAPLRIEGHEHAPVLLVGWGSTYGSLQAALQLCSAAGLRIALLHLRHLNPLPADLGRILKAYPQVFVAELNSGQLCQMIRGHFLIDAQAITQCSGQPFSASTIFNALQAELSHASASV